MHQWNLGPSRAISLLLRNYKNGLIEKRFFLIIWSDIKIIFMLVMEQTVYCEIVMKKLFVVSGKIAPSDGLRKFNKITRWR